MLFIIRQIQEKCREQQRELHAVFVDLQKVSDTVNRSLLWEILKKHGCPDKFIAVLRALHDGATATVVASNGLYESFTVRTGVRQGCVVAAVIFNVFVASVLLVSQPRLEANSCVGVSYWLDGNVDGGRMAATNNVITGANFRSSVCWRCGFYRLLPWKKMVISLWLIAMEELWKVLDTLNT